MSSTPDVRPHANVSVVPTITLAQVRDLIARGQVSTIYYAAQTCWWTHDAHDLQQLPSGLPCGPRGEVLLETSNPAWFLDAAAAKPEHYGPHGIAALVAAHHQNVRYARLMGRVTSWSAASWLWYNTLLDRYAALPNNRVDHFLR